MGILNDLKNAWEAHCLEQRANTTEGFEQRILEDLNIKPGSKDSQLVREHLQTSAAGLRHQAAVRHLPLNKIPAVVEGLLVFRRDIGLTAGILFLRAPLTRNQGKN